MTHRTEDAGEDPQTFPRDQAADIIRRVPSYARLAWNVARDPVLSRSRRGAVLAAVAYGVSPIDAVPGFIPVIGQLDDMVVLVAAVAWALASMPVERRHQHLVDVGLTESDIADDLRALRGMGRWALGRAWTGVRSMAFFTASNAGGAAQRMSSRIGGVADVVRRREPDPPHPDDEAQVLRRS